MLAGTWEFVEGGASEIYDEQALQPPTLFERCFLGGAMRDDIPTRHVICIDSGEERTLVGHLSVARTENDDPGDAHDPAGSLPCAASLTFELSGHRQWVFSKQVAPYEAEWMLSSEGEQAEARRTLDF